MQLLSIMAGAFTPIGDNEHYLEYNVTQDIPSAQKLVSGWPTPMIFSGFEIGIALEYPSESILKDYDYVTHHPVAEAYTRRNPPPHNRPTWDLTSVLQAVQPDRGYFELSPSRNGDRRERWLHQLRAQRERPASLPDPRPCATAPRARSSRPAFQPAALP